MKNNKGFSLVELIIVIAIMAVLVGVLAPTYLQYVEKSKKSNDVSTVDSVVNAVEIAAIDPEVASTKWTQLTITIDTSGTTYAQATGDDTKIVDAVKEIVGSGTDLKLKSSKWGTGGVVIIAKPGTNGKVSFSYGTTAGSTTFKAYATNITKVS